MEDLAHALNAILTDLSNSGEFERFLRDRGWRSEVPIPPRPADVWFDVPYMTRAADHDPEVALR
jgi:hypothetical protein